MTEPNDEATERIREIFAEAVSNGLRANSVSGASDDEIDTWAAEQGARAVPAAVREVLRTIGRDHGLWLAGSSLGVDAVQREAKNHLLATLPALGDPLEDPEGALVLVEHQSYTFHVVDGAEASLPDPPVWLVTEGEEAEKQWASVSFWFRTITPDIARYRERLEVMQELGRKRIPDWAQYIEPR
ncbi:hypothetical protein [Amycolatopsis sp. NPDC051128]|uniref:hypothetical protein n=1 Tax=Amycolatopsis sp. NPDC051128 TaxID=3155412 RepID=UPI0034489F76